MTDRNYYRMLDDEELIAIAKHSTDELALVLGERLLEAIREIEGAHYDKKAAQAH